MKNTLYYGDNLDILRRYINNESVDLIYLDPPFKSNQDYNILFKERNGTQSSAQIGVFITLQEPTKPMKTEAVSSGYYKSPLGHTYPKIQILTIKELLEGKRIGYPSRTRGIDVTFRRAEKHKKQESQQKEMEL